ncbi:MAG: hypothetical protein Q4A78_00630 [Peptostreptococcaceae bacterium]|nr:hypothetical protein [Peptostreptococcaceae bacterium]
MEELTKARETYTPCLHCGLPLHPRELLCPHCETPIESRLPRLDWARAQVLAEYQRQWKKSYFIDYILGLLPIVVPIILALFLHFFFIEGKIIRATSGNFIYYESNFSGFAFLHYLLIILPYILLCGLPITRSAFMELGTSLFYRVSRHRKYYLLYRLFPSPVSEHRRIYLLYYLLSLLLSLSIGHFFLIPSMHRYVYEGQAPFLSLFLDVNIDIILSQLPAIHRFFSAYRFLYYALCFLFFIVYIYRYTTEKDSLCTHDIDERRKAAGIPVPRGYDG